MQLNIFGAISKISLKKEKKTVKTTSELIQEIHANFFTEVDRLLVDAKKFENLDTDYQDAIDKCNRLEKLGFSNSSEVKFGKEEIKRLDLLKSENRRKKSLIDAISYFSYTYPQYKFITEESVREICNKYGLVYGIVDKYLGSVPDKNLKHIEDFSVKEKDKAYISSYRYGYSSRDDDFIDYGKYQRGTNTKNNYYTHGGRYSYFVATLEIAAPLKDFDISDMELKDNKLTKKKIDIPDPVVLQPIMYRSEKYYLIVTAWGDEASDELVVNQKMN